MLTIRKEQLDIFNKHEIYKFQANLLQRYQNIFPSQYRSLGDKQLLKIISYGYDKAIKYGFEMKNQIFLYICLMFKIGSNFDKDIQFKWLSEILKNKDDIDSTTRMNLLYESVMKYLSEISGEKDIYFNSALLKLLKEYDLIKSKSDNKILEMLNYVYPQKYKYFEMDMIKKIIEVFRETTHKYDIQDAKGKAILTLYMFLLGDNFFTDPQFPWAMKAIKTIEHTNSEKKLNLLYQNVKTILPKYYSLNMNETE